MAGILPIAVVLGLVVAVVWHAARGGGDMVVKILYCVFLGVLVVLFVVWAMAAWFPTPQWDDEYPGISRYEIAVYSPSPEELKLLSPEARNARIQEYERKLRAHEEWEKNRDAREKAFTAKEERQGRTVALVSLLIAVAVTAFSVSFSRKLPVISEGLLLGGLFTLVYSIGWSFVRAPKIAVLPVGVGLMVTIALGYKRFVRAAPA